MASLKNELQKAIYARLTTYPALVGVKVYDRPPADTPYRYITIGEADVHNDEVTCKRAWRVYIQIDAWSDTPGYPEVNDWAYSIEEALHHFPLQLPSFRLIDISHTNTPNTRAPDGLTSHAICEFLARVEAI